MNVLEDVPSSLHGPLALLRSCAALLSGRRIGI
jgi:hypothetical protein